MKIPNSTYRLQLNKNFNFNHAKKILAYLYTLGISDIYSSPITQAQLGSTHGYDVIDPNKINIELGGDNIFYEFTKTLQSYNMGLILDIVPNHMAATINNSWWNDVLELGQDSKYAKYFDIYWQLSKQDNYFYRRFFDINYLVCLRMEDPEIFLNTHQLIIKLINEKYITGLRIDHIDGLKRPSYYLELLTQLTHNSIYIIAEKILARHEELPTTWSICGSTGYDFLNELNQIFVNPLGYKEINNFYHEVLRSKETIDSIRYKNLKNIITKLFWNEFNILIKLLLSILQIINISISEESIQIALLEFSALMPVYRSYIEKTHVNSQDKCIISKISEQLLINMPHSLNEAVIFIKDILLLQFVHSYPAEAEKYCFDFIQQWQVFTGPVVAKGYEDTTCYNYCALLSLNEVGSDPNYFHLSGGSELFHAYNINKQTLYPFSLNTSSTHDTKRSEDIRARLNVLSEIPTEWKLTFKCWHHLNSKYTLTINDENMPDINDEWMIYQTLLGTWPLLTSEIVEYQHRLNQYLIKTVREAKVHSNWQFPNEIYEQAILQFCNKILHHSPENIFLASFTCLQNKISFFGMLNSLIQVIVKIMAPGVPDFYQGNEIWRFDLVDPDNRRPVNFMLLSRALLSLSKVSAMPTDTIKNLMLNWKDGNIKLYVIYKLLNFRKQHQDLFHYGEYIPLKVVGKHAKYLTAFMRHYQCEWILVIIPRWFTYLIPKQEHNIETFAWHDTQVILPQNSPPLWSNVFTNENYILETTAKLPILSILPAKTLFKHFIACVCINIENKVPL